MRRFLALVDDCRDGGTQCAVFEPNDGKVTCEGFGDGAELFRQWSTAREIVTPQAVALR